MRSGRNEPCPCGSGLKHKRCCGDPVRRAALTDVANAGAFMPALRPRGAAVLDYCARTADELGENEGFVPDDVVAAGVSLVEAADRAGIVTAFRECAPDVWAQVAGAGDHAERELVGSAIRGAICDRRPVARTQLLVIETAEDLPDSVGVRLSVVLPSGALWSVADAEAVLPKSPDNFLWQRMWEPDAGPLLDRVEGWHMERIRLLCDALRRNLPLASLPRASRIVAADCAAVLRDDGQARRAAAVLLLSHASWVAGAALESASPN